MTHPIPVDKSPEENELLEGLFRHPKEINPKFLYDTKGSELFEEICTVEEYYPTRTEISILQKYSEDIGDRIGKKSFLIEFGAGASIKTRILLQSLKDPVAYAPIDISRDFLLESAQKLKEEFPNLDICPIAADYNVPILLPTRYLEQAERKVAFFPGSTLGNFAPPEAIHFLRSTAQLVGRKGLLLVGIDLIKDQNKLEQAYNDSKGVTAAFNLNILTRMNRELQANFNPEFFQHRAFYNSAKKRIEMHIESLRDQIVTLAGKTLTFKEGETIHTENSYKFSPKEFENFIGTVGFSKLKLWTDPEEMFAVYLLEVKAREF